MLRERYPDIQVFGRIRIGDDSVIGMNCIIMRGTTIGSRCIVGAGSAVTGDVADGTVVAANPARFVKSTSEFLSKMESHPDRLDIWRLDEPERERRLKAHFGIEAPPAAVATVVRRPKRPLR